ncbi:MAG: hypothetical protein WCX12_00995 [Candidatus Paceibacterota bacterium]|jgi:hypothetical protein
MILATHALVGAAVAQIFPKYPLLGFVAAFLSHFILDAIPHDDYERESFISDKNSPNDISKMDMVLGKKFIRDLIKISFDCIFGFAVALTFFSNSGLALQIAFIGAVGGVLPDALQFVYFKIKKEPLITLQKFHKAIQHKLGNGIYRVGILSQIVIVVIVFILGIGRNFLR